MRLLYHHPMCSSSKAIRLLLGEYDISYRPIVENLWESRPDFLSLNASGTLPVLVESDNFAIVGGMVISEYLDETLGSTIGERRMYPRTGEKRAEMRRLCDWSFGRFDREVKGREYRSQKEP